TAWADAIYADVAQIWPHIEPVANVELVGFFNACVAQGVFKPVDQAKQLATWTAIHQIGAAWSDFLHEHPVLLAPICCERPWLVGADVPGTTEIVKAMRMVIPVNILGLPSCAVPVGCDDGLPQGVQLIGRRFREDLLLDAAQAIEHRAPVFTPI